MTAKQKFIVAACAAIVFVQFTIYANQHIPNLGGDFAIYRQAGTGVETPGWFYLPPLRWLFTSFAVFPAFEAYVLFGVVNFAIYIQLPLKLSEYPYGWIVGLVCTKVAAWTIVSGNITPSLAALCVTPAGCILAGVFKPFLFVFLLLHAVAERIGLRGGSGSGEIYDKGK